MTPLRRRTLLGAGAAAALGRPAIVRAASATTLRFVPVIDLAFTDPIFAASAQVSRTHGLMVFDMLYGTNTRLEPSPQMLDGHRVEDDGRRWDLVLRDGLLWHDGDGCWRGRSWAPHSRRRPTSCPRPMTGPSASA